MSEFVNLNRSGDELQHRNKVVEEYLIFQNNLIKMYYKEYPKKLNPTSDYYAVIVEPRSHHKLLEAVCRNVMYFLPEKWNLVIYSDDEEYIRGLLPDIEFLFFKTSKSSLDSIEYSNLLMSTEFWNNIPGENILIFQTDSYITRRFTEGYIEELKKYPFVGAPYKMQDIRLSYDINVIYPYVSPNYSMSGGFSFRSKKAMLHCIESLSLEDIKEYRIRNNLLVDFKNIVYEDFYFEHALYLLKYELPSYNFSFLFCNQVHYYLENTYAVHGIHRDYVTEHLILMLRPPLCELYNEIKYKIENDIK